MQSRNLTFRFWGGLLGVGLGSICLILASYAQGPNLDLSFSREIPSDLDTSRISRNIDTLTRWPQWFYSLGEAKLLSGTTLQTGSVVQLFMDPRKGLKKKFTVVAEVLDYIPEHRLRLRILSDSSERLTRLFDSLEWDIQLNPQGSGTAIKGLVKAHTRNWRARLFGHISEKILMNQVFYPNLVTLAELRQPFVVDGGTPQSGGSLLPH